MKLSTCLDKFSKIMWPQQKHRRDSMQRILRFIDFAGDVTLDDVRVDQVYDFMDYLRQDGLSEATVNRYVAAIQSVMTFGRKSSISAKKFTIETTKEDNRIRYFTSRELDMIEQWCLRSRAPQWFADMCMVARYTGMRHAEVLKVANRAQARLYPSAKGVWYVELLTTKNGDPRKVPVCNAKAVEALHRLAKGFAYSSNTFYRTWDRMRKAVAGNDKQFVFHVFRHTAASTMANEMRLNSDVIGIILGHRNPETTKKYIHAKTETLDDIAIEFAAVG